MGSDYECEKMQFLTRVLENYETAQSFENFLKALVSVRSRVLANRSLSFKEKAEGPP